jgi:DNA repair protein RadC
MILITDEHLKRYTPAQILGLRAVPQDMLCEEPRGYTPEPFRLLRDFVQDAYREVLTQGPVLNSPTTVREFLRLRIEGLEHEEFHVLWLDTCNRLISAEKLFTGTLAQASVHPREVVKRALSYNAAGCILAHNHPSGSIEPSRFDEILTATLKQALALVDVKVMDHFIVAPGAHPVSFAERGLL